MTKNNQVIPKEPVIKIVFRQETNASEQKF